MDIPEIHLSQSPDRIVMMIEEGYDTEELAAQAVEMARSRMPKVSGRLSLSILPVYGEDFFGIYFPDRKVWFQEQGIKPFTMTNLKGAIPMWIDDPTGVTRRENPKAETRLTQDGRTQVKIFRYASAKGSKKTVVRRNKKTGLMEPTTVPRSYPGAPGRIARREVGPPLGRVGRVAGQIASRNVGVRWRHPGLVGRRFLNSAMADTALNSGLVLDRVYLTDQATFFSLIRS